jgi:hypothetical protein
MPHDGEGMAFLDEVLGHAMAHEAEADESDAFGHVAALFVDASKGIVGPGHSGAPAKQANPESRQLIASGFRLSRLSPLGRNDRCAYSFTAPVIAET